MKVVKTCNKQPAEDLVVRAPDLLAGFDSILDLAEHPSVDSTSFNFLESASKQLPVLQSLGGVSILVLGMHYSAGACCLVMTPVKIFLAGPGHGINITICDPLAFIAPLVDWELPQHWRIHFLARGGRLITS